MSESRAQTFFSGWKGREDIEEGRGAIRWHHRAMLAEDVAGEDTSSDFGLLGFRCDEGIRRNLGRVGAFEGPDAFRGGLRNLAWHSGDSRLIDFGNVDCLADDLASAQQLLGVKISKLMPSVSRMLVIGGGHETAYGSFQGLLGAYGADAKIGIINLDAHLDLRTPGERGPSSGTPFYQIHDLTGPDNYHYFCLGVAEESNTQSLFERADRWGVQYVSDLEFQKHSLSELRLEERLNAFADGLDALYLTIDMDVFPHYQVPGVSAPAVRGVDLGVMEQVIEIVKQAATRCRFGLPLADIVELNPQLDPQGVSTKTAATLAARILS